MTTTPASVPKDAARRRLLLRLTPYLLLLPSTLFLLAFFAYPVVEALLLAVRPQGEGAVGFTFAHFQKMYADLNFGNAVRFTLLITLIGVPIQVALALAFASLVQGLHKGRSALLALWAIPMGISDLAAGIVWLSIFTERGYLNSFLSWTGLVSGDPQPLLTYQNTGLVFAAVLLAEIWRATPVVMIILIAGLQLIPSMYSEAAEVFGATKWQRFWRVTFPLLRPSLQTALILRTIAAFEVFGVVLALGGANLQVLAGESYNWYEQYNNPNVAAAYAAVILIVSVVVTLLYLRLLPVRKELVV